MTPTITAFEPATHEELRHFMLTIIGEDFEHGVSVTFGGRDVPTTFVDTAHITVQIPDGIPAGIVPVVVKNTGSGNARESYTLTKAVVAPLAITGFDPPTHVEKDAFVLTIKGTGFVHIHDVTFGGKPATIELPYTPTEIRIKVEGTFAHGTQPVVVSSADGPKAPKDYELTEAELAPVSIDAPTIMIATGAPHNLERPVITLQEVAPFMLEAPTIVRHAKAIPELFITQTILVPTTTAEGEQHGKRSEVEPV